MARLTAEAMLDLEIEPADEWKLRDRSLKLDRPRVMGILNLTPDSFSDGGRLRTLDQALQQAGQMVRDGASLIDVGGESTRPGAREVEVSEEIGRVLPVVEALSMRIDVPISIDTRKAEVARAALAAGAHIVNDVSGLRFDPALAAVVKDFEAGLVVMHMRGGPATMVDFCDYDDVATEVTEELRGSLSIAVEAGISEGRVVVDPGIGFSKTPYQSLELIRDLNRLSALGRPILLGASRKSFLGAVLGVPPAERLPGTVASCVFGYLRGVRIFRVHDVKETVRGLAVAEAIANPDILDPEAASPNAPVVKV